MKSKVAKYSCMSAETPSPVVPPSSGVDASAQKLQGFWHSVWGSSGKAAVEPRGPPRGSECVFSGATLLLHGESVWKGPARRKRQPISLRTRPRPRPSERVFHGAARVLHGASVWRGPARRNTRSSTPSQDGGSVDAFAPIDGCIQRDNQCCCLLQVGEDAKGNRASDEGPLVLPAAPERIWGPLDLLSLVAASVSNPSDTIFWKAALLLPSDHERDASVANQILTEWLESKFGNSEKQEHREMVPNGHMQTLSISSGLRSVGERMHTVHVCVKVARGPLSEEGQLALEKRKGLMGMGALLMLLPSAVSPGADEEDGDIFLLSALLQLRQIQQANAWPQALPLVVVVPGQAGHRASDERLEEDLMLQTLIEEGLISEYMFVHIPETTNEPQGSEQIRHAVRWLAARSTAPARLVSQTLVQVVEAGLCREFAGRLHRDRRDRDMAGLPSQGPAPVIGLYNTVLAFLAGLVSSPSLAGLSWPVAEFSVPGGGDCLPHLLWNSAEHLEWLQGAVLSLRLPDWPLPAVGAPWSQLVASIFQYVSQIPWSRHSQPLLMSQLENLLERLRQDCVGRGGGPDKEPTFWEVPWDEIVMLCVEHQLRDWNPPGCPVSEDVISDDGEIPVYFLSDGLQGFIPPSCWVDAVKQTHRDKQQGKAGCHQSMWPHPRLARPRLQQKLFHSMVEDPESGSGVAPVLDAASSPQDLLARIEEEKEQSRRFEDQLRTWLDVESLGPSSSSSPLFLPSSLLSVPEIVVPSPKMAAPPALALQKERSVRSDQARGAASSMARRLQELEQLISASREEELACELKLSCLLDIVDD